MTPDVHPQQIYMLLGVLVGCLLFLIVFIPLARRSAKRKAARGEVKPRSAAAKMLWLFVFCFGVAFGAALFKQL